MRGLKIFWCFYEKYVCLFLKEKVFDWVVGELISFVGLFFFRFNIGNFVVLLIWKSGLFFIRYEFLFRRYFFKIFVLKSSILFRYVKYV